MIIFPNGKLSVACWLFVHWQGFSESSILYNYPTFEPLITILQLWNMIDIYIYIYQVSWCGLISCRCQEMEGWGGALYSEITCTQLNELNFIPIISKGSCALIRQKAFSGHWRDWNWKSYYFMSCAKWDQSRQPF